MQTNLTILIVLGIIIGIALVGFAQKLPVESGPQKELFTESSIQELHVQPELEISNFSTGKEIYHPNEQMIITLDVHASSMAENVSIVVYGIKDKRNNYRLNKQEKRNLTNGTNSIIFSYTTPSCYGCAGISPGIYQLIAAVSYNEIIVNKTLEVEINHDSFR